MVERDLTRRDTLRATAAAVAGGATAGCTSYSGTDDDPTGDDGSTATGEDTGPHSVTMEPVGTVEFDEPPETWFPYTGDYADMGVALGQADGLEAIGIRRRFGSHHYDELPGVSVDKGELTQLWQDGTDRELFYDIDADVHLIDPNFMINRIQWDRDDVDTVGSRVAPFVGNTVFSGSYGWHDYEQYTLYEAFEKVAQVFQEQERYEAFAELHDEVLSDVDSRLPDERPSVAVLFPKSVPPEAFYPYVIGSGTQSKHWRDLGVDRALAESDVADFHASRGTIDYETLLEVDPDVIAIRQQGEVTEAGFEADFVSHMRNHDVASELRAVRNDDVVYGGMTYQGPIINLFQTERIAGSLYPDEFGGEQLFDRQRVADIVTGEF
ncbi:ABC transporter substrate-binding protein [Halostella salina]|uniref:ABC transporter substrate-binding protein n=1 Tax=Halostella salina TaxID=1547897 RepID=UPI000EF7BE15|nr:ABC transporter substrate-binding protein [Halostella salina]